jgi:hypothetical protein
MSPAFVLFEKPPRREAFLFSSSVLREFLKKHFPAEGHPAGAAEVTENRRKD